ncbi:MAG: helix-turn-helix transcriptional regulator [Bacteroidaceae bacterium]|jgi:transcriptional regulator with XRE-family HTH domain|nr:helix-turn-helix transcriptional regulator [Bacteroidaceae bacterium]
MTTGQAIKTLRQSQGMTQAQLAEQCGMSANAICSLETDKAYPPKTTIERICLALGVPQSYFLLASIDESDFPEEKRVLYRALLEPLRKELLNNK